MQINTSSFALQASSLSSQTLLNAATTLNGQTNRADRTDDPALRKAFNDFVGQTFFGQMLRSMRKTVGETAYFHGGRAEEIFTEQLDQVLAEKMSEASADSFTGPMYDLFTMQRR